MIRLDFNNNLSVVNFQVISGGDNFQLERLHLAQLRNHQLQLLRIDSLKRRRVDFPSGTHRSTSPPSE